MTLMKLQYDAVTQYGSCSYATVQLELTSLRNDYLTIKKNAIDHIARDF